MNASRLYEQLTWQEVADAVERGAGMILPLGAIDQHGPHLPLDTDTFLAREFALAGSAGHDVLVAPMLPFGYRSRPLTAGVPRVHDPLGSSFQADASNPREGRSRVRGDNRASETRARRRVSGARAPLRREDPVTMTGQVPAGYALGAEDGEAIWLQGGLVLIKATGEQTGEQFSLADQVMPRGMSTPIHIQPDEDELFYVVDGTMTFYLDGELIPADRGALVCIPRGASHGFRVESETARFLVLNTPAGHERWFRAAGEPATSLTIPTHPPDDEKAARASRDFGYTVVGPFPDAIV